jgi:hypothetical protein
MKQKGGEDVQGGKVLRRADLREEDNTLLMDRRLCLEKGLKHTRQRSMPGARNRALIIPHRGRIARRTTTNQEAWTEGDFFRVLV